MTLTLHIKHYTSPPLVHSPYWVDQHLGTPPGSQGVRRHKRSAYSTHTGTVSVALLVQWLSTLAAHSHCNWLRERTAPCLPTQASTWANSGLQLPPCVHLYLSLSK